MDFGQCRLCGKVKKLVEGHIWPAFAYKQYVSAKDGGQFTDLGRGCRTNRQYTKHWFCDTCDNKILGGSEGHAARVLRRLDANPESSQTYNDDFIRFATSLTWRVMMVCWEHLEQYQLEALFPACQVWREFLRGKRAGLGRFSQHGFVVYDPICGMHRMLGGESFRDRDMVLSQVGPLMIVGRLGLSPSRMSDAAIWRRSQIKQGGGLIKSLKEWRVGDSITWDLTSLLLRHERRIKSDGVDLELELLARSGRRQRSR